MEIYNPTESSVNIAGYKIERYTNGALTVSGTAILPDFSLAAGNVFTICNTSIASEVISKCNLMSGVLNFNGDDAVVLRDNNGNILDVIGQIGLDPGDEWGSGGITTKDHTLVRNCTINSGDINGSDSFDPATEWSVLGDIDNFENLGLPTACVTPTPTTTEPTPTSVPPTPTTEPTPTIIPTVQPTPTEILPTPTDLPEPTVEPTLQPTPTIIAITPTKVPTPTKEPDRNKHEKKKIWWCERKQVKIKIGRRTVVWYKPMCHWHWWCHTNH